MALWVVILVGMLMLFTMLRQDQETPPDLAYSDFVIAIEDGQIEEITIEEGSISGVQVDGSEFTTYAPTISQDLLALLK
jgi:cell division protease FtsH